MNSEKPVFALTTGDPAGIGPEISLRAAEREDIRSLARLILVGDRVVLEAAAELVNARRTLHFYQSSEIHQALSRPAPDPEAIEILDIGALSKLPRVGKVDPDAGRASYEYIQAGIDLAKDSHTAGVVTAPINKAAMHAAGLEFPGHTEIFGHTTGSDLYAMMMYHPRMAIGLVTCHLPLMEVSSLLTTERIADVGRLLIRSVKKIRGESPRLAVLGLNPHASEGDIFGSEECNVITPAVEQLWSEGFAVDGPLPPDSAFTAAALEKFGAHLCLYHDQGLIPFKMLHFDEGVNVTMGLPFVRTSVDHGTAYDIAGKGIADIGSMNSAITLAAKLAR